jgi:hypothetical protein
MFQSFVLKKLSVIPVLHSKVLQERMAQCKGQQVQKGNRCKDLLLFLVNSWVQVRVLFSKSSVSTYSSAMDGIA